MLVHLVSPVAKETPERQVPQAQKDLLVKLVRLEQTVLMDKTEHLDATVLMERMDKTEPVVKRECRGM